MCEIPDEVAAPWEMTVNSKERRRDVAAAAAGKHADVSTEYLSVSRAEGRRHSDEIGFAAAVQVIPAVVEIRGVLHSGVADDFSAVKLCDFKMNRFTRGRRYFFFFFG